MSQSPCTHHESIEIGDRRWCLVRYDQGGCGGYWILKNGKWRKVI